MSLTDSKENFIVILPSLRLIMLQQYYFIIIILLCFLNLQIILFPNLNCIFCIQKEFSKLKLCYN